MDVADQGQRQVLVANLQCRDRRLLMHQPHCVAGGWSDKHAYGAMHRSAGGGASAVGKRPLPLRWAEPGPMESRQASPPITRTFGAGEFAGVFPQDTAPIPRYGLGICRAQLPCLRSMGMGHLGGGTTRHGIHNLQAQTLQGTLIPMPSVWQPSSNH